ncbi:ATP-binding protein [Actinocrinis puniceicyclus]|uniref:ATP-binding protein n=1 Tax=Actinocrinis puniceicyclus TaxID=977794 RepID=UPI0028AD6E40|nr:ATP-binding protein [Actinocrinis puniceicyclus]
MVPDPRLARLLAAMRAVRDGDLDARAVVGGDDELAELGDLFNQLAEHNRALARQATENSGPVALERLSEMIGSAGAATAPADTAATAAQHERARLVQTRPDPDAAARQVALAARARAEFMANISHELRTPLSSLLILARLLTSNSEGNLSPRQVDYARTIHDAAQDLLQLINDLLDLSDVETGNATVRTERVSPALLVRQAEKAFRPTVADKGLDLAVHVAHDLPEHIESDTRRLQQILRNLLSNAVKFTEHGTVTVEVTRDPFDSGQVRFAVHDTGIGIDPDRHEAIFEAFHHGVGVSSRHHAGSGLGLSISRDLARLLGGDLRVSSAPGQGSTFTLTVPIASGPAGRAASEHAQPTASAEAAAAEPGAEPAGTGRASAVVLVAEPRAARAMQHAARTAIDGLSGLRGRVEPLVMAQIVPAEVESMLLGRDVAAVLVNLSTPPEQVRALLSAVSLYAPTTPVLAYEAGAGGGTAARLASFGRVPGLEVVGSRAQAVERLTVHLLTALPVAPAADLSPTVEQPQSTARFHGEKVLIVDDDVRNVFAMASVLELHGLSIVHADNGRQGIDTLVQHPDIKLVLMDLMMPGMDGYAAIEFIRSLDRYAQLPIVAVSAKAAAGDRERSLAAGADEHVAKPVEVEVLLGVVGSMLSR